jgi:hypothetical protein
MHTRPGTQGLRELFKNMATFSKVRQLKETTWQKF